jgi:hypothetical protein
VESRNFIARIQSLEDENSELKARLKELSRNQEESQIVQYLAEEEKKCRQEIEVWKVRYESLEKERIASDSSERQNILMNKIKELEDSLEIFKERYLEINRELQDFLNELSRCKDELLRSSGRERDIEEKFLIREEQIVELSRKECERLETENHLMGEQLLKAKGNVEEWQRKYTKVIQDYSSDRRDQSEEFMNLKRIRELVLTVEQQSAKLLKLETGRKIFF